MKWSSFKMIMLLTALILLGSIPSGALVKAQGPTGAGDEVGRPASSLPPKVPGQGIQGASSPSGGAADEVGRPANSLPPKVPGRGIEAASSPSGAAADEGSRPPSSLPPKVPGQADAAAKPSADASDIAFSLNSSTGSARTAGVAPDASGVTTWKWWTTAGAGFIPSSNSMTWSYAGGGCIHPASSGEWRASVNLPDGSILTHVYFGYWNYADSTTTDAYVYRYYYTGTANILSHLTSYPGSSGTGAGYVGGDISPNHTVDNLYNAYAFVWSGANPASVQELCYIQVGYIPPSIFGTALPMIVR